MSQKTLSPKQVGATLALTLVCGLLAGAALAAVNGHDKTAHQAGLGLGIAMILDICGFGPDDAAPMEDM